MQREGVFPRLAALVRREGVAGIVSRIRYRRPPGADLPAPILPDRVRLRRNVTSPWGEAAESAFRAAFAEIGVTIAPYGDPMSGPVLHLGCPDASVTVGPNDIVIPAPDDEAALVSRCAAGLVIAHCPAHLERLERCAPGRPHVIAIPPLPVGDSAALWSEWAQDCAFSFRRLAIFCGRMSADAADYRPLLRRLMGAGDPVQLCLTLPEMPGRLRHFMNSGPAGFTPVHGLRRVPGWLGAAESYHQLARAALDLGIDVLTIAQDDLTPGPDFAASLAVAQQLVRDGSADFFSGLVSDVTPSLQVHGSFAMEPGRFVEYRHNVGLVLMVLGPQALQHLARWRETDVTNTIDRHFSRASHLRGLTMLPFPAGHDPDLTSAVWSFRNARYDTMISASEKRLLRLAKAHERGK